MTQSLSNTWARPVPVPVATGAGGRTASGPGPSVPLSIWPGLPASNGARDGLPCGGLVTAAAVRRIIDAFSHPGDLVAAAGTAAFIEACAAAGRPVLTLACGLSPDWPQPNRPTALPNSPDPAGGVAELAVASCRGQRPGGAAGPDPGPVLAACERVLRCGGILAVITAPGDADGGPVGPAGSIVAHARAAGLVYAQHIVLVRATIDGDRLVPTGPNPGLTGPGGNLVHDDLLVFTKPGGGDRS